MNPVLVWVIAAAVTVFHIWASRRRPKYWYLGAIVPALWIGLVVFLLANGQLNLGRDWKNVGVPHGDPAAAVAGRPSGRQKEGNGPDEIPGFVRHRRCAGMGEILVWVLTAALLGAEYAFGLGKKRLLGFLLPGAIAAILAAGSVMEHTARYLGPRGGMRGGPGRGVAIGRARSGRYQKARLDRMKAKDL